MAKKHEEQKDKETILGLLEELRSAQIYGWDNEQDILDSLRRLGYEAQKPSKRAESRPKAGGAETR